MKQKSKLNFIAIAALCVGGLTAGYGFNAIAKSADDANLVMATLPANSEFSGELLHGLEMSTEGGRNIEFNAAIVAVDLASVRLKDPNMKLKNCRVSVIAVPDAGSSRINMKTDTLSCVLARSGNEKIGFLEQRVIGYVVGVDNTAGVPAQVKRREGFKDEKNTTYLDVKASTKVNVLLLNSVSLKTSS